MRIVVFTRAEAVASSLSGRHAFISIADSDQDPAPLPLDNPGLVSVLNLHFDDVLDGSRQGREIVAFDDEAAGRILDYVEGLDGRIDTLAVHCNGGQCRSPAVAGALTKIMGGDDDVWFRTKRPNSMVYRTLLEVHHDRLHEAAASGTPAP